MEADGEQLESVLEHDQHRIGATAASGCSVSLFAFHGVVSKTN